MAIPFVVCSTALFLLGAYFCYSVVLPFAFAFFYEQYQTIGVTPTIRIKEHISLILKAVLGFGLVFEMPVLAFFLGRFGMVTSRGMLSAFRYAIVAIFLVSALLTPPDVLTQFLMAGPLIILYFLSTLVVWLVEKKKTDKS